MYLIAIRLARMVGRRDYDAAIDYLRAGLCGDTSDIFSLELIARCHRWRGRNDEAITASREALALDPLSFNSHVLLAELLAEMGEHEQAASHARKGLEAYPEPFDVPPRVLVWLFGALRRIVPLLRNVPNADELLKRHSDSRAEWFNWAKKYLSWYDTTFGEATTPSEH